MKKMRGLKSFTFRVDVDDRISQLYNRLDALPLVIRNFMSFSRNVDRVDLHTNCTAIFCSKSYGIFRRTYATAMYERGSRQGNDQMLFFFQFRFRCMAEKKKHSWQNSFRVNLMRIEKYNMAKETGIQQQLRTKLETEMMRVT